MRGKSILKSFIVMLSFGMICLVGAQAHAMTLEEYMNNYAIPTAIYNTEITQNYLNEDTTEEQVRLPSGDFVLKQTDYVLPGVNGLDLKIGGMAIQVRPMRKSLIQNGQMIIFGLITRKIMI